MTAVTSEIPSSHREGEELLERNGFRRGQLFAGKYRLEGLLGEGGMGIVLLATHVDLQRTVAIKVVRSELARNEEVVERLLAEAQAAARIRSEHVTRVLDLGRLDSGSPYIVLEYLEGRDLAALLDEHGPLPCETAIDFVLQVCDALAEAHSVGIIHRDLKPENLFLTRRPDGTPIIKLIDFGISKNLSARDRRAALTNPAQLVGSPYYMAPEQMRGTRMVDARADIWALGVVLYELCTGQTPFAADSIPAVCHLVMQENPTPPRTFAPELPEEVEDVILCCLHKDPMDRYADVSEFAAALAPFGTQEGLVYADRVQRVLAAGAESDARTSGAFSLRPPGGSSRPDVRIVLDGSPDHVRTLPNVNAINLRTPAGLARSRGASLNGMRQSGRRKRRRRAAWATMATGIVLGAALAAAITWLPIKFNVDHAAEDLAAVPELTRTQSAAAANDTTAPLAEEPTPVSDELSAELEPLASTAAPTTRRASTPAPRQVWPKTSAPPRSTAAKASEPAALEPLSTATPAAKTTASAGATSAPMLDSAPPAPPTKPRRSVVDPWDRKSFGGRR